MRKSATPSRPSWILKGSAVVVIGAGRHGGDHERNIIVTASKATPQEFHDNHYRDAHEEYIRWLRHNPRGFVLNLKTAKRGVLHESDCIHIADYSDPDVSLTDKRKVCAPSTS